MKIYLGIRSFLANLVPWISFPDPNPKPFVMRPLGYFLLFLTLSMLSFGCGDVDEERERPVYGGTLDIPQSGKYQTLYPFAITDLVSFHVASQIHEGLFKFDPEDMTVEKALLKDHEVSKGGKVHTFTLKDSIYFHPDPCFKNKKERRIDAEDVRFSFELICTPGSENESFKRTFKDRVKGANAFYNGEADRISGFEKLGEKRFRLELKRPSSSFLYVLSLPSASIVSKKAIEEYGNELKVGAGPFRYSELRKGGKELLLQRFEEYHMKDSLGDPLPYLDSLHFHFIDSKAEQLERFKKKELHVLHGLPTNKVKSVVKKELEEFTGEHPRFLLSRVSEMSTEYYHFNLTKEIFQNIHVRKAFSYAIDRQRLVNDVLRGEAYGPGVHGITPPSFDDYNIKDIEGYSFDPEKAKKQLQKAGYPEGKGFPSVKLQVNSGRAKNTRVATDVQKQLREVLNINVEVEVVSFAKKLENARNAKGDIWRSAWVADYPSPENFLWLTYGKQVPKSKDEPSFPNVSRYKNAKFDSLYEKGMRSMNKDSSYAYFKKAEQIMMDDAPLLILWYRERYRLLHSSVQNFPANPMKYFDFRRTYIGENGTDRETS